MSGLELLRSETRALCVCTVLGLILSIPFFLTRNMAPQVFVAAAAISSLLLIASWIDVKNHLLLDVLTIPLTIAGIVYSYAFGPVSLLSSLLGAAIGYGVFWSVSAGFERLRGEVGLGLGDAKLLAGAGAWCGVMALPFIILAASLSALIWVALISVIQGRWPKSRRLAFGPFLSAGFFTVWAWLQMGFQFS